MIGLGRKIEESQSLAIPGGGIIFNDDEVEEKDEDSVFGVGVGVKAAVNVEVVTETGDFAVGVWKNIEDAANLLAYCRSNRDRVGDGTGTRIEEQDDCREDDVYVPDPSEDDRFEYVPSVVVVAVAPEQVDIGVVTIWWVGGVWGTLFFSLFFGVSVPTDNAVVFVLTSVEWSWLWLYVQSSLTDSEVEVSFAMMNDEYYCM